MISLQWSPFRHHGSGSGPGSPAVFFLFFLDPLQTPLRRLWPGDILLASVRRSQLLTKVNAFATSSPITATHASVGGVHAGKLPRPLRYTKTLLTGMLVELAGNQSSKI